MCIVYTFQAFWTEELEKQMTQKLFTKCEQKSAQNVIHQIKTKLQLFGEKLKKVVIQF